MIFYKSTRGNKQQFTFSEVVLKGIADDGGLFVPDRIPNFSLDQLRKLVHVSYQDIASFIFSLFETDFSASDLKVIISHAYSTNFDSKDITPIVHLIENQYILELWHGPTAAFKDLALQIMPLFFEKAIETINVSFVDKNFFRSKLAPPQSRVASNSLAAKILSTHSTNKKKYLILVATSGDTGKAALEGFKNKKNISIIVFYPENRVSQLQELQMRTQEGENVEVIAVKGDFDAVQSSVKQVFNDSGFNQSLLEEQQIVLSSANSIDWGRLMPQIVYHVFGYLQLVKAGKIALGDEIDIAVPSGNFGNILAAFLAKKMGLPVKKLICASNINNILTEFLRTGIYDISDKSIIQTPSPSMDILVASNIERLLFFLTNDAEKVAKWMRDLQTKKRFQVDPETFKQIKDVFSADWIDNEASLQNIKAIFKETGYVMDPHTSVAQLVTQKYLQKQKVNRPVLICSTAHYAKFPQAVFTALTGNAEADVDVFEVLKKIQKLASKSYIPKNISDLQKKSKRHSINCNAGKEAVEEEVLEFISR